MVEQKEILNPYPDKPEGWFGSDSEAAIEYYAKQKGWDEGFKVAKEEGKCLV